MNVMDFYKAINGDYDEIKRNLISEEIIEELVLDFLEDTSFTSLKKAFEAGDVNTAFLAAHTLKGVSASLGFKCLSAPVTTVTEKLRGKILPSLDEINYIEAKYNKVIAAINMYK